MTKITHSGPELPVSVAPKKDLIEELSKEMRLYQRNIGETQSIAIENDKYKGWTDHRRPDGKKIELH